MADYKLVTEGNQWPDWYILTATKNMLIEEGQFENYSLPITRSEASKIIGNYINIEDINNKEQKYNFTGDNFIFGGKYYKLWKKQSVVS
mgnify:CR=1 FL=1